MKKIALIIVAALAIVGVHSASAQSRTSYFMEGSYFRNDLNPALVPTRGYVALPVMSGFGLNATNNFISIDNFVYQREGELVTALHSAVTADEFLSKLPQQGKLTTDVKTNLFSVGFYIKKSFWNFGINANVSADAAISMDVFKALKTLGNGVYDLGNTAIEANAYMDAFVGTSFRVHRNINVGIKAKFLVGVATLDGQFSQLQANVTPDAVDATMQGTWRANGIFIDNSQVKGGNELPIDEVMRTDISYMLNNLNNFGFAVDLGAEVRLLDDHLKISAAVTDLGFIKWGGKTQISGKLDGSFNFAGMNLETSEMDTSGDFNLMVDEGATSNGYTTMLNFALNVGAEYNILKNHIAFGLLSHTKFCGSMTYSELTASVNFRPLNWITATFSHTFLNNNRLGVLGFALNIHPRVFNIYAGLDFIDTNWVKGPTIRGVQPSLPRYQKSLNAYVGFGFNFGRPKFLRAEKAKKRERIED